MLEVHYFTVLAVKNLNGFIILSDLTFLSHFPYFPVYKVDDLRRKNHWYNFHFFLCKKYYKAFPVVYIENDE